MTYCSCLCALCLHVCLLTLISAPANISRVTYDLAFACLPNEAHGHTDAVAFPKGPGGLFLYDCAGF